jgi:hypothetical protein
MNSLIILISRCVIGGIRIWDRTSTSIIFTFWLIHDFHKKVMEMIDHISRVVKYLKRSVFSYDGVLIPSSYTRLLTPEDADGCGIPLGMIEKFAITEEKDNNPLGSRWLPDRGIVSLIWMIG